jgi:hypothetical protein
VAEVILRIAALVVLAIAGGFVGGKIGAWVGKRYYARKVRQMQIEIGRQVMESVILPQTGFPDGRAFSDRYVEANGTVETDDLEYVRAWLEGVADRLREVGIQFVSQSYVAQDGAVVRWSIGASDPVSTRDELALMVGNAIEAAGGVPDK